MQKSAIDMVYNKQLLNEVVYDIENYQGQDFVDNTNRGLDNSRYNAKTEFNNCFVIGLYQKSHVNRLKAILFRLLRIYFWLVFGPNFGRKKCYCTTYDVST